MGMQIRILLLNICGQEGRLIVFIDLRSGERACNSAYACRDGKMLVVTKNRTKCVGRSQRQLCSLQAVGTLEFFDELYSLRVLGTY